MVVRGERNWLGTHRSVSRHARDVVGSYLFREQGLCPTLLMTHKRLPRTGTAHRKHMRVSGFLCRVYIDLNRHDSQI
jgi:hypothetical protein